MTHLIRIHDFDGGIHPPENKHQSTARSIKTAPISSELILPLHQHVGAAAKPVVSVGERVLKGQLLAEAHGMLSVPIHAPTSGVLSSIEERHIPHASGLLDTCLILQTDGLDEWYPVKSLLQERNTTRIEDIDASDIVEFIRQSGIAGMGGAGFPTAVKLHGKEHNIETLILNAAECEPYITADDMLMRERASEVVRGTQILLHILGAKHCMIGIEDNKPEAIQALNNALQNSNEQHRIDVVVVPTKYPSGGEKQLIQLLTGQEVPVGGIPAHLGIVCQNVATAAAIAKAVDHGEPLLSRITTVTGDAIGDIGNWDVLLGTPIEDLLLHSGYKPQSLERVIMGGPMMGFTLPNLNVPIIKTSNCLLAPTREELPPNDMAMACIRCGHCASACPSDLLPQQLYWFSKSEEFDKAEQHNLFDCIECGACSYVCPSHIPLVQYYRYAKGAIREERAAALKAEQAKERFEARLARQEREQAEKEAKRKARAAAAAAAQAAKAQNQETAADSTSGDISSKNPTGVRVDREQVAKQIDAAKAALVKTEEKLASARADETQSDKLPLLETAVEKAKAKIAKLEKSLQESATKEVEHLSEANSNPAVKASSDDLSVLTKKLKNAENRLKKAQAKLLAATPEDDQYNKFQEAVVSCQNKVDECLQNLTKHSGKTVEPVQTGDTLTTNDREELEKKLRAQEDRVVKARERLGMAEADNLDTVPALTMALNKQIEKLETIKQKLD